MQWSYVLALPLTVGPSLCGQVMMNGGMGLMWGAVLARVLMDLVRSYYEINDTVMLNRQLADWININVQAVTGASAGGSSDESSVQERREQAITKAIDQMAADYELPDDWADNRRRFYDV